jgi:ribonuclease D
MGNQKMANVATLVPTTLDELADCELPQNVQQQFGERLIKNINAYIEQENLQQYVENRPKKKRNTTVSLNNHGSSSTLNYVPDSEKAVFEDRMDVEATMAKVKRRMS